MGMGFAYGPYAKEAHVLSVAEAYSLADSCLKRVLDELSSYQQSVHLVYACPCGSSGITHAQVP